MNNAHKTASLARIVPSLLIGTALLVGNAFAADPATALPSVTVKFEDLNLQSAAGIAALYKRIHVAARNVCALPDGDISMDVHALELTCAVETESRTIDRMHVEALSAYHRQRTGTPSSVAAMAAAR